MQVMLLAAGSDKSLIEPQIEYLAREGAELVVVNADPELVEGRQHSCRVEVVDEAELLGSAGGLRNALSHFERHMPVAVLKADAQIDAPLHRIVDEHIMSGLAGTVCATWLQDVTAKNVVTVDFAGNVTGFEENPPAARPGLASAGLYVLDRELAALIPHGVFCELERDLFPLALDLELGLRVEQLVGGIAGVGAMQPAHAEAAS
jgi:NDP-sugar pyrophosphorylase family protein